MAFLVIEITSRLLIYCFRVPATVINELDRLAVEACFLLPFFIEHPDIVQRSEFQHAKITEGLVKTGIGLNPFHKTPDVGFAANDNFSKCDHPAINRICLLGPGLNHLEKTDEQDEDCTCCFPHNEKYSQTIFETSSGSQLSLFPWKYRPVFL